MTGFSYKKENGSYEVSVREGYTGSEDGIKNFAQEYWELHKPIKLFVGENVNLPKVIKDVKGRIMDAGVWKYIVPAGPQENPAMFELLSKFTEQAIDFMEIKILRS